MMTPAMRALAAELPQRLRPGARSRPTAAPWSASRRACAGGRDRRCRRRRSRGMRPANSRVEVREGARQRLGGQRPARWRRTAARPRRSTACGELTRTVLVMSKSLRRVPAFRAGARPARAGPPIHLPWIRHARRQSRPAPIRLPANCDDSSAHLCRADASYVKARGDRRVVGSALDAPRLHVDAAAAAGAASAVAARIRSMRRPWLRRKAPGR